MKKYIYRKEIIFMFCLLLIMIVFRSCLNSNNKISKGSEERNSVSSNETTIESSSCNTLTSVDLEEQIEVSQFENKDCISVKDAIKFVEKYIGEKANGKHFSVEWLHIGKERGYYYVHVFDISHLGNEFEQTWTYGWYYVDCITGRITDAMTGSISEEIDVSRVEYEDSQLIYK